MNKLWPITKEVVLAPLPYSLAAFIVPNGVMALYWFASGWAPLPDWFRVGIVILVTLVHFAALVPFCFRQAREASEEIERLIESRIRIRKLRDEL